MMHPPAPSRLRTILMRLAIALIIVGVGFIAHGMWARSWRPDARDWPIQGVAIGPHNSPISWPSLASQGASFAYIDALDGSNYILDIPLGPPPRRQPLRPPYAFQFEQADAEAAGLRVGAIHHFAICTLASDQAAAFVRSIPRDPDALPPVIILDLDADCPRHPTQALLLSELSTFLNQIETHMGKMVIIAPSPEFEDAYHITAAINRPLWQRSPRAEPDSDGPAWTIWQANDDLRITGSTGQTRWLVLHDATSQRRAADAAAAAAAELAKDE
jgi:lysozyme